METLGVKVALAVCSRCPGIKPAFFSDISTGAMSSVLFQLLLMRLCLVSAVPVYAIAIVSLEREPRPPYKLLRKHTERSRLPINVLNFARRGVVYSKRRRHLSVAGS